MNPYEEKFPAGSVVRVATSAELEEFRRIWKYHNPLKVEQLAFADATAVVKKVGFYHGGDVLYELQDLPGTWHEACLRSVPTVDVGITSNGD